MTSSHDARQDWQASVLRDLTPTDGDQNGGNPFPATEMETEADDDSATQRVRPASFGARPPVPMQAGAAPELAPPLPDPLTSDPLGMREPAPPPHFQAQAPPAASQVSEPFPPGPFPPGPFPPEPFPPGPFPPGQVPTPQYSVQSYSPAPQQPIAYPATQHYAQAAGYPPAPGYPAQTSPAQGYPAQTNPAQSYPTQTSPGEARSRVFGPDATPIPEEWTPDGLLPMPEHADNWHQRFRSSIRGVGGSAAKASREAADIARELAQPVTTGRRIAVLGIRGGSGKSTVASLLASAYATHRGDRVLAVDADPDLGSLGLRLGSNSPTSLASLGRVPRVWQTVDEAERCLGRAPSGAWVLAGERNTAGPESVTPNAYLGVVHGISRYFAVTVIDAGAGMVTALNQSVLADAHTIVLATPASVDGVMSARRALEWIREWGPQRFPQTIVVLTAMSPQASDIDMGRTIDAVAPFGVAAVLMPYDRHLATGSKIEPWRLGDRTRSSAVRLAAAALSRAGAVSFS